MTIQLVPNASKWYKKYTTWLGVLAASMGGGLAIYATLPERAQALFPDWALGTMSIIAVVSGLLVPVAAAISQPKITKE